MASSGAADQNQSVPLSEWAFAAHLGMLRDTGSPATARESRASYSLPPGIATSILGLLQEEFCLP